MFFLSSKQVICRYPARWMLPLFDDAAIYVTKVFVNGKISSCSLSGLTAFKRYILFVDVWREVVRCFEVVLSRRIFKCPRIEQSSVNFVPKMVSHHCCAKMSRRIRILVMANDFLELQELSLTSVVYAHDAVTTTYFLRSLLSQKSTSEKKGPFSQNSTSEKAKFWEFWVFFSELRP